MFIDLALEEIDARPKYEKGWKRQVYVLRCEEGKYYVGTSANVKKRVRRHKKGKGAKWTKKYKPLELVEVLDGDLETEELTTLVYMQKYGIENVRGSKWCHTSYPIPDEEIKVIAKKIKILKKMKEDA